MRIVFAPHAYAPAIGGAERYTQGLAEALAQLGHEVHVVAPDVLNAEAFYEIGHARVGVSEEVMRGVTIRRLPFMTLRYRMSSRFGRPGSPEALRAVRSGIERYRAALAGAVHELDPDVVVTLPHRFPNVDAAARARIEAGWRLVYAPLLHESDPSWSIEHIAEIVAAADGVIALTSYERDRLVEGYGARGERTAIVPPGVDLPIRSPGHAREPIVLFLGRRSASKRLDALYVAMQTVWEAHPETQLVVAGSRHSIESDPADAFVDDPRVRVIDDVSDQEKAQLLEKALALVSPSVTESFGITTLEAWSHGLPVVAVDTPIARSVIRPGVDGLLVDADPEAMATGINAVIADRGRGAAMGAAGRLRAGAEFTWRASALRFVELVSRVSRR